MILNFLKIGWKIPGIIFYFLCGDDFVFPKFLLQATFFDCFSLNFWRFWKTLMRNISLNTQNLQKLRKKSYTRFWRIFQKCKQNLICNIFETTKFSKFPLSCKFVHTQFLKNRLKNPRHHFLFSIWWRFRFPQISSLGHYFWLFFFKFLARFWHFWKLWWALSRWIRKICKSYEKNPILDFNADSKNIIKI